MIIGMNKTENITFDYSNVKLIALISQKFVYYLSILSLSIGIPGNIISILIFIKPCLNKRTNTGFLYTFLCTLNLIAILYNALVKNSTIYFHREIRLPFSSNLFIENILLQFLSWLQVLITFDRFIAVVFPIKGVRIMSKRWVLYSIILGMFVVIIGLNSPYFIRVSLYLSKDQYETQRNIIRRISVYLEIIKVLIQVFIPYLIMVVFDSITIIHLWKVKKRSERQFTQSNNSTSKSWRFTRNTILIDLIYLIFNLLSIFFVSYLIIFFINVLVEKTVSTFAIIFQIFNLFPYIYSSFLFILFICFNRIFRAEFFAMIIQQRFFIFIKNFSNFSD